MVRLYTYTVMAKENTEVFDEDVLDALDYIAAEGSEVLSVHFSTAADEWTNGVSGEREQTVRYSAMILVRNPNAPPKWEEEAAA